MKNLILTLIIATGFILFSSCDSGTNNDSGENSEGTENRDFGGEGADPSSGTVVSEDTAIAPIDQNSQNTEEDNDPEINITEK